MSGGAVTAEGANFLAALQDRWVAKPFKAADLRNAIQRLLVEPSAV